MEKLVATCMQVVYGNSTQDMQTLSTIDITSKLNELKMVV